MQNKSPSTWTIPPNNTTTGNKPTTTQSTTIGNTNTNTLGGAYRNWAGSNTMSGA